MNDQDKTQEDLLEEMQALRQRVATLEASERRFRTIIDTVPLAIGEINRDGIIIFANAATEKLFGYKPEELVGKRAGDGIEPETAREAFRAWFRHTMLEQPAPSPVFAHQVNKNGEQIDVRGDWNYLRNEKEEAIGQVTVIADITEQKRAEEELREREARLLEAQEVASLGFYVLDIFQGRWSSSSVLDRIFDIPADYARTVEGWDDLVHPDERQLMLDYFLSEVVGNKKPFDCEYRIVRYGDKQLRWVRGRGRLQFNAEGQPVSMLGTIQDITERRQVEDALRESETRFRSLFRDSSVGTIVASPAGEFIQANRAYCEFLGYSEQELRGKTILSVTHPDDREASANVIHQAVHSGPRIQRLEKRYLHKSGRVLWGEVSCNLICDADGKPDYFIVQILDITVRKRAEEALQEAHDELEQRVKERTAELAKANEELAIFRKFADASGQGFSMADLGGHLLYLNPTLCRMLGEERQEIWIGQHLSICYSEEANRRGKQEIEPALMRDGYWQGELLMLSRQGKSIPTWQNSFVIRDERGNPLRLAVVITDITERKQAEEALERERRTLKHMLEASDHERRLISYDIHDGLAQELAGAMMQFQIYAHARESKSKDAAKVFDAGMAMLQQSHVEARRLISGVRPPILDESGVMAAIAHLVYDPAFDEGPKIDFRNRVTFKHLAPVMENVIYRIVQEGLTNARNHSKSKKVLVSLKQRDDRLRIEIRDWGVGFDPKTVHKNRFGLQGIRERARLLEGKCSIKSKPGEGTSIVVELPVAEREPEQ